MHCSELAHPTVSARRHSDPPDANFMSQREADRKTPIRSPKARSTPVAKSGTRGTLWNDWLAQYFEPA
jgi:hypothetical protein